ncbi:MAG: hypothetical protein PVG92_07470 [Holophagae bacterium]
MRTAKPDRSAILTLLFLLAIGQAATVLAQRPDAGDAATDEKSEGWFTHAEGDYRFPLDAGWRLIDSNEEMDILMLEDESLAMFCRRTHLDIGAREPFPMLRDLADDLIGANLNSDRWDGLLDENEAVFAQAFNAASEQIFWHVYFHHKQRAYYIGLATAPGAEADARFPTSVLVMLKGIEFLD